MRIQRIRIEQKPSRDNYKYELVFNVIFKLCRCMLLLFYVFRVIFTGLHLSKL